MARKEVRSEVSGKVWQIEVKVGDRVAAEDVLIILESMKMEIPVLAPIAGTVAELRVALEQAVEEGAVVAAIET
ncbi:MAG TPA: biotin/lipoyl-binding carrier protein [Stellaceae bacterium]|nr:biotin/lipoyl-binding carrier protein [Stellaceae bacterium]